MINLFKPEMQRLLATAALAGLMTASTGQVRPLPYHYDVASYQSGTQSDVLRIFPSKGAAIKIAIPFRIRNATFSPDGKSVYGVLMDSQAKVPGAHPGLSKVDFNPTRATPVLGTNGFAVRSYAFSPRQDKVVISGKLLRSDEERCGLFEVLIPEGNVRQILTSDCHNPWSWDNLSLASDGLQAIATAGSNASQDLHLELIDLVHGTTKSLGGELWIGAWSPDGKWIVAREGSSQDRVFLIDAIDFSRRRSLGGTIVEMPAWSPDSRYLLLWKVYLFRCGIYSDLEPPATLETLDIQTGKRLAIASSRCQITSGPTGWISKEITK